MERVCATSDCIMVQPQPILKRMYCILPEIARSIDGRRKHFGHVIWREMQLCHCTQTLT